MEKNQKLLVLANGFLGALAARGVTGIATDNIAFEGPFLSAWRQWQPTVQSPEALPKIEFGATNQPRNIIFRVDSVDVPVQELPGRKASTRTLIIPRPRSSSRTGVLSCRSVTG